eukprot:scaffold7328_cov314-Pinguiococcus_pyrenoidosus.AAC.32
MGVRQPHPRDVFRGGSAAGGPRAHGGDGDADSVREAARRGQRCDHLLDQGGRSASRVLPAEAGEQSAARNRACQQAHIPAPPQAVALTVQLRTGHSDKYYKELAEKENMNALEIMSLRLDEDLTAVISEADYMKVGDCRGFVHEPGFSETF